MGYEEKFFSCNHRIYSENILLSSSEVNRLCDLIRKCDRFTILITDRKDLKNDDEYTKESERFFNQNCANNLFPCAYDFSICIFASAKKLKITAGKEVTKLLKWNQWDTVLQEMLTEMKQDNYYDAIEDGMYLLDKYAPYDTKHPPINDHDKDKHESSSFGFGKFLLFILLPICGIVGLWYYYKKTKENATTDTNDTNDNHSQLVNRNSDSIFSPLKKPPLLLNTITNDASALRSESSSSSTAAAKKLKIHNHITFIIDLLKQVNNTTPPLITIDKCIICQQKITCQASKQYIEMMQVANDSSNAMPPLLSNYQTPQPSSSSSANNTDNQNTRFGCLHLYHRNCLQQHHLMSCIMCFQSSHNAMEIIPNNYDTHVIEEAHLQSLLKYFTMLYQSSDLMDYSLSYQSEFNYLASDILQGIESYWKIQQYKSSYVNGYTAPILPNYSYEKPTPNY